MRRLLCLVVALSPLACGGPSVGDLPIGQIDLSLLATTSDPSVAGFEGATEEGGLLVQRAFLSTSALRLVPCTEGAATIALRANSYDLVAPPLAGELVDTAVTNVCRIELDLAPFEGTGSVTEGASIFVGAEDADAEPLQVISEQTSSLVLEVDEGEHAGDWPLFLAFDVASWFEGLPTGDADADRELIETRLPGAVALYEDTNYDHVLDEDEMTNIAHVVTEP